MKNANKLNTVMMDTAILWSKQSFATRRQVGAVLARDGRVLVTSYNGTISGESNVCEIRDNNTFDKEISCPDCTDKKFVSACLTCNGTKKVKIQDKTNEFVLHAEQNVICYAAKNGIKTDGCELYITLSPCKNCAKLIAQCGISKVYYHDAYKDTSGIEFLSECGIIATQL